MRARNLKPGIFKNELLGTADLALTVLFQGLWCMADREGRLEDRPLRIKAEIFPYRNLDIEPLLAELCKMRFIERYQVGEVRVIQVVTFVEHQTPHPKEKASTLPSRERVETSHVKVEPSREEIKPSPEISQTSPSDVLNPSSLNPESLFPGDVEKIAKQNPRIKDPAHIPRIVEEAIVSAIIRDGMELVLAGTQNFAEKLKIWPKDQWRFAPSPENFYNRSLYRSDPEEWERGQSNGSNKRDQEFEAALRRARENAEPDEIRLPKL